MTSADRVLRQAKKAGVELRATPEGSVMARPPDVPPQLREAIAGCRTELVELLLLKQRQGPEAADRLSGLRRFAPRLFRVVRLKDGSPALLWGVTPHGVIVSPSPGKPLLTLDPGELDTTGEG